jgi:hypothetical protein
VNDRQKSEQNHLEKERINIVREFRIKKDLILKNSNEVSYIGGLISMNANVNLFFFKTFSSNQILNLLHLNS